MNLSLPVQSDKITPDMIQSLQSWWSLAGVDSDFNAGPGALLQEQTAPASLVKAIDTSGPAATAVKHSTDAASIDVPVSEQKYPENYDGFMQWLNEPINLIERNWSANFTMPSGQLRPKLMIITALPERTQSEDFPQFDAKSAALLANMLKAMGYDSRHIYISSLAFARPVTDRIDPAYLPRLEKRILHQIKLVQPEKLLLFGDTLSKLFFKEDLLTARKKKQFINHVSSKVEAVVTFHPQILLQRPEFKAEAWKDLQILTRISAS